MLAFAMPTPMLSLAFTVLLFALWQVRWLAGFLNQQAYPSRVPAALEEILTSESLATGHSYLRARTQFFFLQSTLQLLVFLTSWWLGGLNALHLWCASISPHFFVQATAFFAILTLAISVLDLPLSYYQTFVLEEKFGFNRTSHAVFWSDFMKNLALSMLLILPILLGILTLFVKFEQAWFFAWLGFCAIQLLLGFLAPTWLMPLFFQFTPMPDGSLREKIALLAARAKFPIQGIFIIDGSKRSSKANAFFTGFGSSKRIALFDTLLASHSDEEILAILAHEIGHFQKGHIRKHLAQQAACHFILFAALGFAVQPQSPLSRILHEIFFLQQPNIISGAFAFFLILSPLQTFLAIYQNARSRQHEFEADAYAAQLTGEPHHLVSALQKLSAAQLAHPTPHALTIWLDHSHPPLIQRLHALAPREKCTR